MVVASLRQLLSQVRGKLLVIWDGTPIHLCQEVKDVLSNRYSPVGLDATPVVARRCRAFMSRYAS
jgi:hypothetical protein